MKKKSYILFILLALMIFMPSAMAVNIQGCSSIAGLENVSIDVKIANTVHSVIVIIKIAVPIVLVILGMLDLFKGMTAGKEDEMKKGQGIFIKRLISAAIIFFVVSIVQLIITFVSDVDGIMSCANCFINGADSSNGLCAGEKPEVPAEETE